MNINSFSSPEKSGKMSLIRSFSTLSKISGTIACTENSGNFSFFLATACSTKGVPHVTPTSQAMSRGASSTPYSRNSCSVSSSVNITKSLSRISAAPVMTRARSSIGLFPLPAITIRCFLGRVARNCRSVIVSASRLSCICPVNPLLSWAIAAAVFISSLPNKFPADPLCFSIVAAAFLPCFSERLRYCRSSTISSASG